MKKILFFGVLFVLFITIFFSIKGLMKPDRGSLADQTSELADTDIVIPQDVLEHIGEKSNLIIMSNPAPLSVVSSPLIIEGEARGTWFFEASFPISIVDWDGRIIAEGHADAVLDPNNPDSTPASAETSWMTEDFVPFKAEITFTKPENIGDFSNRGAIILQKNNPSNLPENDDALEIPIRFWE